MGYALHEPGLIRQISKITTINIIIGMKWGPTQLYSGKEEMDRIAARYLEYLVKSLLFSNVCGMHSTYLGHRICQCIIRSLHNEDQTIK